MQTDASWSGGSERYAVLDRGGGDKGQQETVPGRRGGVLLAEPGQLPRHFPGRAVSCPRSCP